MRLHQPKLSRRHILAASSAALLWPSHTRAADLGAVRERALNLPRVHSLIITQAGEVVLEESFAGPSTSRPVNIKSLAKTLIATLTGIAIDKGHLDGPNQPITEALGPLVPDDADPQLGEVTIGNLLSMQAGLERTSGQNYGRWVTSPNWVNYALTRPFTAEPGGPMLYSTGNSHLLSAILTQATGRSTHQLANDWLGQPLDIQIPAWDRDPQGIYMGGNNMLLSPRAIIAFGEMIRRGGRSSDGEQLVSETWIDTSWQPRTNSRWTGHAYGYGWFITHHAGHPIYYGWGYGGQMLHLVPSLDLTIAITSDPNVRSRVEGHMTGLRQLVAETITLAAA